MRDLLAADLLGFQTDNDVAELRRRRAAAGRRHSHLVGQLARAGRAGACASACSRSRSTPHEFAAMAEKAGARRPRSRTLRRSLDGQRLMLGVDRLDPTKGLPQRLAGYRRLLETRPEWRRQITLLQIAAVSRKEVGRYRALRTALDGEAGAHQRRLGRAGLAAAAPGRRARRRAQHGRRLHAAARVGLVTPLRDGMNLVAKEYVAAQDPQDPGRAGAVALRRRGPAA